MPQAGEALLPVVLLCAVSAGRPSGRLLLQDQRLPLSDAGGWLQNAEIQRSKQADGGGHCCKGRRLTATDRHILGFRNES